MFVQHQIYSHIIKLQEYERSINDSPQQTENQSNKQAPASKAKLKQVRADSKRQLIGEDTQKLTPDGITRNLNAIYYEISREPKPNV